MYGTISIWPVWPGKYPKDWTPRELAAAGVPIWGEL